MIHFCLENLKINLRLEAGSGNARGLVLSLDLPGASLFLGGEP
jgi:hypothetical protein